MWLARYLPFFSELNESSTSSPPCKNCARKRWLLSTEGLLAAGGICLGTRIALKGQSEGMITAFTTGALCICLVNSVLLHFPVTKPSSWVYMLTGGVLSGAGIGWCLTAAFKEQPKSTIIAYLAGAISICLTNSIMFYVPSCIPWYPESIQKVSKSVSSQTEEGNSQTRVTGYHTCDSCDRPASLGDKDVEEISKHLRFGEKQCPKCHSLIEEKVLAPDGSRQQSEEPLATKEVATTSGLQEKRINSSERKKNIKRNLKRRRKRTPRSKQREMTTSGSQSGYVSESLDSHQQIKMQTNFTIPPELSIPRRGDEPVFILVKANYTRNRPQGVYFASRFQEISSTLYTSGNVPPASEGSVPPALEDKDNCSEEEALEDKDNCSEEEATDYSRESKDLSTYGSLAESAKGETETAI